MWTLKEDLELTDLVTWWLKCPVLQSDPGPPGLCGSHGRVISCKAEGDIRKEPPPQAADTGTWQRQTDYFSLPFQAGAPKQRRAGRKDSPSQRRAVGPMSREPSHAHSQAQLPGRAPVSTEEPAVPASLGVWAALSHPPESSDF